MSKKAELVFACFWFAPLVYAVVCVTVMIAEGLR